MEEVSWNEHRPSWTKCDVQGRRLSRAYWMGRPVDGFCQDVAERPMQKVFQDDAKIAPVSRERVKNGACMGRDRSWNRDVVWKETGGVQVDDEGWEAVESFQSLERMASWVLECGDLDVEVGQRMDLVLKLQALKVEEEVGVPVEGRLAVQLEVVDVMVQVLDEVKQVWQCLDVAVHEVLGGPHLGGVVHVDYEKRTQDPL